MSKAVFLAALLVAASGCKNACLSLADQICACEPDSTSQSNCTTQAQTAQSTYPISSTDEQFCQSKLDLAQCNCGSQSSPAAVASCCAKLNTLEGRQACGLVLTSP
jgi:hypothetical protein